MEGKRQVALLSIYYIVVFFQARMIYFLLSCNLVHIGALLTFSNMNWKCLSKLLFHLLVSRRMGLLQKQGLESLVSTGESLLNHMYFGF